VIGGRMTKLASVLIVDDNPRCLEFMTLAFEAHGGVEVSGEMRPVAALERIRAEKPDLVVLDVKMPDLDGFGVLAMLRGEGNPVPVVMCSGSALQKDVDRAYAGGCSGYVEKPSTLEDYRAMARAIVEYWRRGELPKH
jgi:CheY-like chemotaxis protein